MQRRKIVNISLFNDPRDIPPRFVWHEENSRSRSESIYKMIYMTRTMSET